MPYLLLLTAKSIRMNFMRMASLFIIFNNDKMCLDIIQNKAMFANEKKQMTSKNHLCLSHSKPYIVYTRYDLMKIPCFK